MRELSKTEFDLKDYLPLISEVIESGGEFRLFPRGTSMLPLIRQGKDSVVLVKPKAQPKRRDIIFYQRSNGQFVLHRIVKALDDNSYILCGDNQAELEKGITSDMIIAVVSAVYRGEKRKEIDSFGQKAYSAVWCCMPLRRFLFLIRRILSKIKRLFK